MVFPLVYLACSLSRVATQNNCGKIKEMLGGSGLKRCWQSKEKLLVSRAGGDVHKGDYGMRPIRIAIMSMFAVVGCVGIAMAEYDPYTPTVDEDAGVPTRCTLEWSAMSGQDHRKNDLAYKVTAIVDTKVSPAPTVYFQIAGQRLARSVEKLEITQAGVDAVGAGGVKLEGGVVKASDNGMYSLGTTDEHALLLPLAMADGSTITFTDEDDGQIVLKLPPATAATKQTLFSCYQRATGLPASIRPEMPDAPAAPAAATP
jgi:hypothetical protein